MIPFTTYYYCTNFSQTYIHAYMHPYIAKFDRKPLDDCKKQTKTPN